MALFECSLHIDDLIKSENYQAPLGFHFRPCWPTNNVDIYPQVSLTDSDPAQFREFFNLSEYNEVKQHQPLRLKKKFYEFYTAPITKFWADSVSGGNYYRARSG